MLLNPYAWIVAGSLFFLIIAIVVWFSPIIIVGSYRRHENKDEAFIKISGLYGLAHYRLSIPEMRVKGLKLFVKKMSTVKQPMSTNKNRSDEAISPNDIANYLDMAKRMMHATQDLTQWMKRAIRRLELKDWRWHTSVGTGDAMWTAMITGGFWTVKTTLVGFLSQYMRFKALPTMKVDPVYSHPSFSTEWSCIAEIRFGNAIVAGLVLIVRMLKEKGGVKAWQSILFKA